MNVRTETTKNDYFRSLGVITMIGNAIKRGEFRRDGDFLVYKVNDEERRMHKEECVKHYGNVKGYLGKGAEVKQSGSELIEMLKKLENET